MTLSERVLRLGTRKSPMAMAQSARVAQLIIERTGHPVELVGMSSFGDTTGAQLDQIGGQGVFVSALRVSLAAGDVDLAVHSLKDLPTAGVPDVTLAAVPVRDDPRDALIGAGGAKLADLPVGARIGTGSPRRAAQLKLMRPDLMPVAVRGNAGTRLAKVTSGELGAVVLAYAGLARLHRLDVVSQVFDVEEMVPAPGQGALAVECRTADTSMISLLSCVDDPASRAAVTAERVVLAQLEAGCSAPLGAYAAGTDVLQLTAFAMGDDGGLAVRARLSGPASQAERLGRDVAAELLRRRLGRTMAASAAAISDGDDAQ
jgi:hydroxymethylbilane synthase